MFSSQNDTLSSARRMEREKKPSLSLKKSCDFQDQFRSVKTFKTTPSDCLFCEDEFKKVSKKHFSSMISKALYSKYPSSQNYYYTKDVNDILADARTEPAIIFKDYVHFDEEEEYLKRFYFDTEYDFKIKTLTEYYKFHNDIPRIFMTPSVNTLNKYHDQKRRLEYIRITKMLQEEQEAKEGKAKGSEKKEDPKDFIITDRILDELDLTELEPKKLKTLSGTLKSNQPYVLKSPPNKTMKTVLKNNKEPVKYGMLEKSNPAHKNKEPKRVVDQSISHTIQDLHLKLGEIINSSSRHDTKYLENSELMPNETLSNLANFLNFIDKNNNNNAQNTRPANKSKEVVSSKPTPKILTAAPVSRPQTALSTRSKNLADEIMSKIPDSRYKMTSPTVSSKTNKREQTSEKAKDMNKSPRQVSTSQLRSSLNLPEKSKGISAITKIKNFEEALKVNTEQYQQKMAIHASLPRDNLQDKLSAGISTIKNSSRMNTTRTPSSYVGERSRQCSISKQKSQLHQHSQQQLSARNLSRTKSKGKLTDRNTKVVDLLLESQDLEISNPQKELLSARTHRNTKSSSNFDGKIWNHHALNQDEQQSFGKENLRVGSIDLRSSYGQIVSNKLAAERIYMQTEREAKKVYGLRNLDAQRKDIIQVPLSARELSKDSMYRNKDTSKLSTTRNTGKSMFPTGETENVKPSLAASLIQKKIIHHKYTKSEGRLKRPGTVEKMTVPDNNRKSINKDVKGSRVYDSTTLKQNYMHSDSNIANMILNSTQEKTLTSRIERQSQEGFYNNNENDSISRMVKTRSPNTDFLRKSNSSISKKLTMNCDLDFRTFDFSQIKMLQRENQTTQQSRILTERSPSNLANNFHRRGNSKNEFEHLTRDIRYDKYDSNSRSKEKVLRIHL